MRVFEQSRFSDHVYAFNKPTFGGPVYGSPLLPAPTDESLADFARIKPLWVFANLETVGKGRRYSKGT